MTWYFYVYVLFASTLADFFWLSLFQRAESSLSSKSFQTSIEDSENISDYENLEVTSALKERVNRSRISVLRTRRQNWALSK